MTIFNDISKTIDLVGNTIRCSNIFTETANTASLWQRPSSVSSNGIPFSFIINENPFTGGVGGASYIDEVVSWGWNLSNTVQVSFDSTKAATFDTWESKFFPGSGNTYVVERHIGMVDTTGAVHRAVGFQLPWDGLGSASVNSFPANASFVLDFINFNNFANTQIIKWDLFGGVAQIQNGYIFSFNTNNYRPLRQSNVAGNGFVNLPWVDNGNNIRIDSPAIFGANGGNTGSISIFGGTSGAVILTTPAVSTGALQFASTGSFSANGAVATSLTGVGPTGSHTTVQTWLTILDNTGITRYIPCF